MRTFPESSIAHPTCVPCGPTARDRDADKTVAIITTQGSPNVIFILGCSSRRFLKEFNKGGRFPGHRAQKKTEPVGSASGSTFSLSYSWACELRGRLCNSRLPCSVPGRRVRL